MARKPKTSASEPPQSRALPAEDLRKAVSKIERRIADLESFDVHTITEQFDAKAKALEDKINTTIADIFGHGTVEYKKYDIWSLDTLPHIVGRKYPLHEIQAGYQKGVADAIIKLRSLQETLKEKLDDISQVSSSGLQTADFPAIADSRQVFVVHGRDEGAKQAVARFIEKLELIPVILHEQPSEGHTVIEKFEKYSNVGFAVVLMTPDDVGALAEEKAKSKPRARQNVILELGFFLGKLGRHRVCALYKEDVEIPSDYKGVLFILMDPGDGWKLSLAKEIKAAGIQLDLNKAI